MAQTKLAIFCAMFPRLDSGQDGRVSKEEFLSDNLRATLEIVRKALLIR